LDITKWHHERIDGNGYPDNLLGIDIPLSAKIVALADAMTSDRPYRKGFSIEQSLDIINKERFSGQWDPDLVIEFLKLEF